IYAIDLLGTLVFAISGILMAIDKKLDLVGAIVLGFVTAIGGGSLRDMLIGQTPVGWMQDINYVIIIFGAVPICYFAKKYIIKLQRGLFLFDTIGIGLYTILGLQKTLSIGLSPAIAILMGVVSASFGGLIRDVLTGQVPLILRKEIYASACALGGIVFLVAEQFFPGSEVNMVLSILVVTIIRYLAVRKGWSIQLNPLN
ncbi:MAG: trimeric intracellular cation channel family protein, partial [Bacteroidota bacterium]